MQNKESEELKRLKTGLKRVTARQMERHSRVFSAKTTST